MILAPSLAGVERAGILDGVDKQAGSGRASEGALSAFLTSSSLEGSP
jgi:hypothetical protein